MVLSENRLLRTSSVGFHKLLGYSAHQYLQPLVRKSNNPLNSPGRYWFFYQISWRCKWSFWTLGYFAWLSDWLNRAVILPIYAKPPGLVNIYVETERDKKKRTGTVKRDNHNSIALVWLGPFIPPSLPVQSRLWIFSVCPDLDRWLSASCWSETSACRTEKRKTWYGNKVVALICQLYYILLFPYHAYYRFR